MKFRLAATVELPGNYFPRGVYCVQSHDRLWFVTLYKNTCIIKDVFA